MAGVTSVAVLRDIQTLFDTGTASGLTDKQLLDRFASRRDAAAEAAFEVLVLRHGPMVLRVCHNMLRDSNDAQDAFQATFLVLVRRSGSSRKLDSVGGWLYGVACRVAARARVDAARRRSAEERAALRVVEAVDSPRVDEPGEMGFGPIVQEEVRRLPEKYRAVVVLCYWQGLTHEQAAAQLGCPLGTVRSRMARARNLLRRRLIRRGMAPLGGVVAAGLDRASASGVAWRLSPVPPELIQSTIHAAGRFVTGQATAQVVSGSAASLVQGILWSMTMIKIKMTIAGVVLVGLMGSGGWFATLQRPLAQAQPKVEQKTAHSKKRRLADSGTIYSLVEGQTAIFELVPDGSPVKKGDIVGVLDSAALKDQMVNQKITRKAAEANYENSRLEREVAEISVVEYVEGIFKLKNAECHAAIKIAEAELALAEDELSAFVKNAKAEKATVNLERKRAELAVLRARWAREIGEARRKALIDFTKPKELKALKGNVEKAKSNELAKKASWALEVSKEKKLERQIANCTIVAPRDGTLVYAPRIEEGAAVRERQILFNIVPPAEPKVEKP